MDGQGQRPPMGGRAGWPQGPPRMAGMLNGAPNGPGTALLHALQKRNRPDPPDELSHSKAEATP